MTMMTQKNVHECAAKLIQVEPMERRLELFQSIADDVGSSVVGELENLGEGTEAYGSLEAAVASLEEAYDSVADAITNLRD